LQRFFFVVICRRHGTNENNTAQLRFHPTGFPAADLESFKSSSSPRKKDVF
jgi:hypothetical protein